MYSPANEGNDAGYYRCRCRCCCCFRAGRAGAALRARPGGPAADGAVPDPADAVAPSDYDAPFKNTVNGFGIYQPQDQLAWLGKITCDRIDHGVDHDAHQSATFIQRNLPRGTTEGQSLQFLGAAVDHYCPEHIDVVQAAGNH
ncbi:DUF732 domain-containing protein [Mycobacterium intracellulare]|uniref:DUF732 domain-containing protein n=1 Tax=Mycobacterium intracellulare TaxID=1767 RepID=UPI0003085D60